jgi:hypothetical protein
VLASPALASPVLASAVVTQLLSHLREHRGNRRFLR